MKKALFLIATLIYFTGAQVMSQTASVVNYSSLEKKLNNSNDDIQNDKKNTKVSTWTDRAELLVDIFNVHNDILYAGMGTAEAKLMLQNPKEIQTLSDFHFFFIPFPSSPYILHSQYLSLGRE